MRTLLGGMGEGEVGQRYRGYVRDRKGRWSEGGAEEAVREESKGKRGYTHGSPPEFRPRWVGHGVIKMGSPLGGVQDDPQFNHPPIPPF